MRAGHPDGDVPSASRPALPPNTEPSPKNRDESAQRVAYPSSMLSGDQLRRFGDDGYLVVPGVVAEDLLVAVDSEIDALIAADPPPADTVGKHFWFLPPERLPAADAALRRSGALDIAAELVAPHRLDHGLDHIQIALNYSPHAHRPGGPHLDGHRPEQERPHSFTMLAAIYLVDEQERQAGNLWVWPGSHLDHQQLFRERGARALLPVSGHTTMLDPPPELHSCPSWRAEGTCSSPTSCLATTPAATRPIESAASPTTD